ncbi:FkbM family methyltransferase [Hahella ganghwensis]|uniref:FkbM family methyltransferase n=1 Tax=Hahella ganghwensis TaxID=286420 RepID=UPI0003613979|nr:FkbM family methyltransferase [Hahella ganghwensis]
MSKQRFFPSAVNWIITQIQRYDPPGKYFLYQHLKGRYGRHLIKHRIDNQDFYVPWDQWCFWYNRGPENYYLDEIDPFLEILRQEQGSIAFIDLGADIGIVSALVASRCKNLSTILAVEPNPRSYDILALNAAHLPVKAMTQEAAISNFTGSAYFHFDESVASDHEGHISLTQAQETSNNYQTKVTTFDTLSKDLALTSHDCIAIKLDVEGQEKAFFEGASETIKSASKMIVLVELHPDVLKRENMTPEEIFEAAEKQRNFKWLVPLEGNQPVDRKTPFYDQFKHQQYDVIGITD